jgi:hypothetical protein
MLSAAMMKARTWAGKVNRAAKVGDEGHFCHESICGKPMGALTRRDGMAVLAQRGTRNRNGRQYAAGTSTRLIVRKWAVWPE